MRAILAIAALVAALAFPAFASDLSNSNKIEHGDMALAAADEAQPRAEFFAAFAALSRQASAIVIGSERAFYPDYPKSGVVLIIERNPGGPEYRLGDIVVNRKLRVHVGFDDEHPLEVDFVPYLKIRVVDTSCSGEKPMQEVFPDGLGWYDTIIYTCS